MTHYENLNIDLGGDGYVLDSAYIGWDGTLTPTPYRLTFKDQDGYEVEVARVVNVYYSYDHPLQQLPFEAWLESVADSIVALAEDDEDDRVDRIHFRGDHWQEAAWLLILDYIKENFNGQ